MTKPTREDLEAQSRVCEARLNVLRNKARTAPERFSQAVSEAEKQYATVTSKIRSLDKPTAAAKSTASPDEGAEAKNTEGDDAKTAKADAKAAKAAEK